MAKIIIKWGEQVQSESTYIVPYPVARAVDTLIKRFEDSEEQEHDEARSH